MMSAALALSLSAAAEEPVRRIEPLSWWVGMNTPLQLMVQGPGIGAFDVTAEGLNGVKVTAVHKAESPNYLFVDIAVGKNTRPGTCELVFRKGKTEFRMPYTFAERNRERRRSFSSADLLYLIVPDRFSDGDPSIDSTDVTVEKPNRKNPGARHGGDLRGIIDHLDYIRDLGATAIWCTPLLEDNASRGSYHGYACTDYYHIDPRFGSNGLYREYVQQAHRKGLKIVMDVVTNHCSTEHWWMQDLPFPDWVHMNDPYVNTNHQMSIAMDPNASQADRTVMEAGWFVPSMPDMNLGNPFVLKYFQQWAVWWVEFSGLDGFRVDTWYYNEKEPMAAWAKAVRDEYPWLNIVGENWTTDPDRVAYWQAGHPNLDGFDSHLPTVMDFPLQKAISDALEAPHGRKKQGGDILDVYNALSHDFLYKDLSNILIFLSNHDVARVADTFGRDPRKMKIAYTLLATLRGIPQLFYGDEMMFATGNPKRDDGRLRMDFPGGWAGDRVNLFTPEGREKAKADTAYTHAADLYNYASTLFRWRRDKEVIHSGKTLHFLPQNNTYGYFRYNDTDVVFVFVNNSPEACKVPWTRYQEMTESLLVGRNVLTGETQLITDNTEVEPYSTLVVEFDR